MTTASLGLNAQFTGQTHLYSALLNIFKNETEWIAVVDCDEYFHSGRHPELSMKQVLMKFFPHHDALIVPEMIYGW